MNQFFLETDVSAWTIQEVYERAAKLRGWSLAALEQQMEENFRDVFGVLSGGGQL
jgi:Tat protein secretion system quality control protein TatD with DNase activity